MKPAVERLAADALLHDIVEFRQRTGQSPPFTIQERQPFGAYDHSLWTGHFIERGPGDGATPQSRSNPGIPTTSPSSSNRKRKTKSVLSRNSFRSWSEGTCS